MGSKEFYRRMRNSQDIFTFTIRLVIGSIAK